MAKQTVNIGTEANDGTGDPLRTAFDKINDNFDEIYNTTSGSEFVTTDKIRSQAVDSDQIATGAIDEQHLNATNSPTDGYVLTFDNTTQGFTWEQKFDGDITSIVAGDGLTGSSLDSGDATLNVNVDDATIEIDTDTVRVKDAGITNAKLADNAVDHDELADRYTETSAETSASTLTLNKANADTFTWTAGHSVTVSFSSVKKGDTATLVVTGGGSSYTFALSQINGAAGTFNKISGTYDDTSGTKNLIEFKFVSTSEAWYQISQIAS